MNVKRIFTIIAVTAVLSLLSWGIAWDFACPGDDSILEISRRQLSDGTAMGLGVAQSAERFCPERNFTAISKPCRIGDSEIGMVSVTDGRTVFSAHAPMSAHISEGSPVVLWGAFYHIHTNNALLNMTLIAVPETGPRR